MITLHGFGNIFAGGHGETKDLWAQWTLEETGLPYRVHALDHGGGELDSDAYKQISPFSQAPVIDDDGFVVAESAAIALYLAEKAGKLIPSDAQGRTRVVQWCFAAVSTVLPTLLCLDMIEIFDSDKAASSGGERTARVRSTAPPVNHLSLRCAASQFGVVADGRFAGEVRAHVVPVARRDDAG